MIRFNTDDVEAWVNPDQIVGVYFYKGQNQWIIVLTDGQRWPVTNEAARSVIQQIDQPERRI